MNLEPKSAWDEKEYVEYLNHERHMLAWCLVTYGAVSHSDAKSRAEEFYKYEPETAEPYRGMVFHDEAFHYAMIQIFGGMYWKKRQASELESALARYRVESKRYHESRA
jgi:hypothetical protein